MSPSHAAKPERNVFSGLKSRLGFSNDSYEQYSDEEYGGGYEEFEEYGEGYDAEVDDAGSQGSASYGSSYSSSYDPSSRMSYTSRRSSGVSSPPLVSFNDVKARTQLPDSLLRDPLATRPSYSSDRTMVEASNLHHPSSPNGRAAAAASQNSATGTERSIRSDVTGQASSSSSTVASSASSSYDPYDAYAGRSAGSHIPSRSLKIIRPLQYGDVESVAKAIKAGDAVILALASTPEALAKRVLDFSFGVASALDASVDCVSAKVFAITRNGALTQAEKTNLKNQGIL